MMLTDGWKRLIQENPTRLCNIEKNVFHTDKSSSLVLVLLVTN
jgi:hypothetical protein